MIPLRKRVLNNKTVSELQTSKEGEEYSSKKKKEKQGMMLPRIVPRRDLLIFLACVIVANCMNLYHVSHPTSPPTIYPTGYSSSIPTVIPSPIPTAEKLTRRPEGYDVIDIGSSKGSGSINFLQFALKELLGDDLDSQEKRAVLDFRTLGLDYDPEKVETCNKAQEGTTNKCQLADILTLTPESLKSMSKRKVRGNSYWHVLEHIPNCTLAQEMWTKAADLSKSFSSFHGPAYDNEMSESGVEPTGYHRYWENWVGHTCHFNSTMLEQAMKETAKTTAYIIINFGSIESTDSSIIVPKGTANNSHHYNSSIHPPKESLPLGKVYYEEMRGCAIYDKITEHSKHMSLFSALCLRDTLRGLRRFSGLEVVSCSFGSFSGEECVQLLSVKVMETIMHFYKQDLKSIIKNID